MALSVQSFLSTFSLFATNFRFLRMTKPSLDSIASAKAKLAEELRKLEEQEVQLLQEQAADAFAEVANLVSQYGKSFSAKQRAEIVSMLATDVPKKTGSVKKEVAPKYWLPHTGETWSGRGRTPRAFAAWEGTSAYTTWKASHPNEKFPAFPG